jgi:hypothetical protein
MNFKIDKEVGFRFCIGQKFSVKGKVYTVDSLTWKGSEVNMVGFTDGEKRYQKLESELIRQAKEKVIRPL